MVLTVMSGLRSLGSLGGLSLASSRNSTRTPSINSLKTIRQ